MKKRLTLSEDEIKFIEEYRKEKNRDLIVKKAILKHDLYFISSRDFPGIDNLLNYIVSKEELDVAITSLKDVIQNSLLAPAKTEFVCYLDEKKEQWFDNESYGIECKSSSWAAKHLTNIKLTSAGKRLLNDNK